MAATLEREIPGVTVVLMRGGRGDFIVTAGDSKIWDKKTDGGMFPNEADMVDKVQKLTSPP